MILRPYQVEAVRLSLDALRARRRVVCVLPTGAGKTVVGAAVAAAYGPRVAWTAHRRELIAQARAKLPRTVGVFSVQQRTLVPCNLLVVDEAHHSISPSYRRHIDAHTGPILGLTATPYRLDGRGLGEVFDSIVSTVSVAQLVRDGVLVAPRTFACRNGVDLSGVGTRGGDFKQDALAAVVDKPAVIGDAVREYQTKCPNARAVAFCVTVDHAHHVADAFNAAGIQSAVVSGEMPNGERDAVLARLAAGTIRVVANCQVLTEGWDLPSLDAAIVLRPTASRCLHLQMIGRVMRAHDGKTSAVVLDHAGNTLRLGFVTTPVEFSLEGAPASVKSATGLVTCRECYAIFDAGPLSCPVCGAALRVEEEQRDLIVGGLGGAESLEAIVDVPATFAAQAAEWESLERARVLGDRPLGWSVALFKHRFNEWPILDAERRLLDPSTDAARRSFFATAVRIMQSKGRDAKAAAGMFKGRFGVWPPWAWTQRCTSATS